MTTLSLYLALFLGFNQDRAVQYCYEAEYSLPVMEAYRSQDDIALAYAKQEADRQEKVCTLILDKYMSSEY